MAIEPVVRAAQSGDDAAWTRLVASFDLRLRRLAGSYGLQPADVDDVLQTVWLRLFLHFHGLRDPAAIAAWLDTTTRRESLRALQRSVREEPTDAPYLGDRADAADAESQVLDRERRAVLRRAVDALPERHRRVMSALVAEPALGYDAISAALDVPKGSIGPIRARSLARLQRHPELCALRAAERVANAGR